MPRRNTELLYNVYAYNKTMYIHVTSSLLEERSYNEQSAVRGASHQDEVCLCVVAVVEETFPAASSSSAE